MRRIKREDDKGAMGVGTLIVFIAMVLVAAVAASVLIDTANQLQQQAERTGDEAIREVSSSFQVQDVFGETNESTDANEIQNITLKIGLAAGATGQDLNQTIVQLQNKSAEVNLQGADGNGNGAASENLDEIHYDWSVVKEQDGDKDQYVESGDLYKITINLQNDLGGTIGTQEQLDINIIPKHGTPTYEQVVTPPTITSTLVDL